MIVIIIIIIIGEVVVFEHRGADYSTKFYPRLIELCFDLCHNRKYLRVDILKEMVMKMQVSEMENGIRLLKLSGKLDSVGVYNVEVDFISQCSGDKRNILVDISKVTYISSIGIPMLVNAAKLVIRHGGKFALLSPQKSVMDVLEMVGVSGIIHVYHDTKLAKNSFLTA